MSSASLTALRVERRAVLDFCRDLTADDWTAPSRAEGWSVKDVVAHMTAGLRALITPAAIPAMTTRQIERLNDRTVDKARSRTPEQVTADFTTWTTRGITALGVLTAPGVGRIPLPVGELGIYPLRVFPAMYVFDWHTHLRHDLAPALDRPQPATDDPRMSAVVVWLMALLEQSHRGRLSWLDTPISLALEGPGTGTWRIERLRKGTLRVRPGTNSGTSTQISAQALEFPAWGTTRTRWRDSDITITGVTDIGERFLDTVKLV